MTAPVKVADPDVARLEDDGAPVRTASTDQHDWPRLVWAGPAAGGSFDGAWWPHSRNAIAELESIVGMVGEHLGGVVTRASLNMNSWDCDQPRRMRVGTSVIRLGWFRSLDPATATFGHGIGPRVAILVVPPEVDPAIGRQLMQRLASAQHWPADAAAALPQPAVADRAEVDDEVVPTASS
jgi:hypothetical protein